MSRRGAIDRDPKVRALAAAMGIEQSRQLLSEIPKRACDRVGEWIATCGIEPASIDELHRLVLNQTRLRIERIETDLDLERITNAYEPEQPAIGTQLELEFEQGTTEALVLQRSPRDHQYLAIVDARGDRRHRAWFSSWHEPSHLVVPDPEARLLFRRTQVHRPEPLEQVIDAVASSIGFWEPIIRPALVRALRSHETVLEAFDAVREACVPEASRESTYRALAAMVDFPLVVLRVGYGGRRGDVTTTDRLQSYALRAKTVIRNGLAEGQKLVVWPNFRIPRHSAIVAAFERPPVRPLVQHDRLENWTDSKGNRLGPCAVRVTAHGTWSVLEAAS